MTDLEITKLCAEAMGYKIVYADQKDLPLCVELERGSGVYFPLKDDAQAMALVKKFKPLMDFIYRRGYVKVWIGEARTKEGNYQEATVLPDDDLNRAICLCVAKMQQAKERVSG